MIIQISVPHNESDKTVRVELDKMTLVKVGPRFCLNPIKIFAGSFARILSMYRVTRSKQKAEKYTKKVKSKMRRKMHELSNPLEPDEFADMWRIDVSRDLFFCK